MSDAMLVACLLAGVGTWAFRVVPLLAARRGARERGEAEGPLRPYVDGFLSAMAVASVAALLVSGVEPYLRAAASELRAGGAREGLVELAKLAVGVAVTTAAYLWRRGVALGTVAGAAAYGLAHWLLGA